MKDMLGNENTETPKFRTKYWDEVTDQLRQQNWSKYNKKQFKTAMLKSSHFDFSDTYLLNKL